jgi:hypothetical protein
VILYVIPVFAVCQVCCDPQIFMILKMILRKNIILQIV